MKYISVTVETTSEAADIVSLIMIDEGTEGVSIQDPSDFDYIKERVYWDYADTNPLKGDKVYVTGVYDVDKDIATLKDALAEFKNSGEIPTGSLKVETTIIDSADYEDEWKKYYQVIEIGELAIVPAWINYEGDKAQIKINPGKAFGTGSHETTSMCLKLLQEFEIAGKRVIDVGCGSGILGLSAMRLGAKQAYLSDIDPQAVEATNENMTLNGLENGAKIVGWGQQQIDEFFSPSCGNNVHKNVNNRSINDCNQSTQTAIFEDGGKADICLANLTADILISLKPNIHKLVKKGGVLIISGIINEREGEIRAAFSDLTPVSHLKNGQWQAFSFII